MRTDYDVQRAARRCAATGRMISPGEEFYSCLAPPADEPESELIERHDYCREAWQGPPAGAVGWWKARLPEAVKKPRLAPNEVLLDLFDRWADDPARVESRYVLTLLLVRRRVLKLASDDEAFTDAAASDDMLTVTCPERDAAYQVTVAAPDDERTGAIQAELMRLLYEGQPGNQSEPPTTEPKTPLPVDGSTDQKLKRAA